MKPMSEYDAESILARETFEELFSIEDDYDHADAMIALTERAYDIGKSCGDNFKVKYRAFKKQFEKEKSAGKRKKAAQTNMTEFGYFEDGHELDCGLWQANNDGVKKYSPYGMEEACKHPILITRILTNAETKKQKIKIAYKIVDRWDEITVDKGLISTASKITALSEYGIDATSENAKYLVKYLSDLERNNLGIISRKTSSSKFGWIGGEFIPYGVDIEFDGKERFQELFESVSEKGSLEAWLKCVKAVRASGRKEPLVYLAGSFASILLSKLDLLPFVINLWEETGKGKTVSMMVAASVWGDPRIGKFMTDVGATGTSYEVRSDVLNHLPLMIDDLSKAKESYGDAFTDLIYAWCSGKGKDRSDQNLGLRKSCTWCNITMTSYERPLATENMRGGAINRVLDFQAEPGDIFTKKTGNETVSAITANYGFAGQMFVNIVSGLGIKKIREMQQGYLEAIDAYCLEHGMEKEDKQKLPLSVLLTADELTEKHIFQDGVRLDLGWCIEQLKGKNDVSENQRAYDKIMQDVNVHINCFKPNSNGEYTREFWGGFKDGYIYIIPMILDQMADRNNFSKDAFLRWAKSNGMLLYDKNKNQKTTRLLSGGEPSKFYAIKLPEPEEQKDEGNEKQENSDNGDEFMEVDEQIELPFD